jgi:hypothetical protein
MYLRGIDPVQRIERYRFMLSNVSSYQASLKRVHAILILPPMRRDSNMTAIRRGPQSDLFQDKGHQHVGLLRLFKAAVAMIWPTD